MDIFPSIYLLSACKSRQVQLSVRFPFDGIYLEIASLKVKCMQMGKRWASGKGLFYEGVLYFWHDMTSTVYGKSNDTQ